MCCPRSLRLAALLLAVAAVAAPLPAAASPPASRLPFASSATPGEVVCDDPSDPASCFVVDSHLSEHQSASSGLSLAATSGKVTCFGDGVSGPRVEAFHVVSESNRDRRTDTRHLTQVISGAARIFEESSLRHGGPPVTPRFVHDRDCVPTIQKVVVPDELFYGTDPKVRDHSYPTYSGVTRWLKEQGHTSVDRKFLLFADGTAENICGLGSFLDDPRPGLGNIHNWHAGFAFVGRSETGPTNCWASHTVVHELLHTFGAVNYNAPNSSGAAHCVDEWDVMCYPDAAADKMNHVCPQVWNDLIDCGGDDYFHPAPPKGSYLTNNWNTYNSRFLGPISGVEPFDMLSPQVSIHAPSYLATTSPTARVVVEVDLFSPAANGRVRPSHFGDGWAGEFVWDTTLPDPVFVDHTHTQPVRRDHHGDDVFCSTVCLVAEVPHGSYTVTASTFYEGVHYSASKVLEVGEPTTLPSPPKEFIDSADHVFRLEIASLAAAGVTKGCNPPDNTRFCPDEPVTRGQMAAFLYRALKLPSASAADDSVVFDGSVVFGDSVDTVFAGDIAAIAAADITRGCNPPQNTRFCPDQPVTRGQMAAFLARALGLPAAQSSFLDTVGHTFQLEIAALAEAGITKGCNPPGNDLFCPDEPVTRGQMAAFLVRAALGF